MALAIAGGWSRFRGEKPAIASSAHQLLPQYRLDAGTIIDVRARGAKGDGRTDDTPIIQRAIDDAHAASGGTVFFPNGRYRISQLHFSLENSHFVRLKGENRRTAVLVGGGKGVPAVQVGGAPVISGQPGDVTYYGSIEDLTIAAGDARAGTGLHLVQTALFIASRVSIEGFRDAGGAGLVLEGSTTRGGLGSLATPHCLDNRFYDLLVVECDRPVVLQNADENSFIALRIGQATGAAIPARSRAGVEIRQGRNNRFFGATIQGDVHARDGRVGIRFCSPVNSLGEAAGDVKGNNFHGLVIEGCEIGVWFESSPYTAGNVCHDVNFSICQTTFRDDGRQNGYGNGIVAPLHGINYRSTAAPSSDALTFPINSRPGAVLRPRVSGGNVYACANEAPTRIDSFEDAANGQLIVVRLDGRTTLMHSGVIRLAGGVDFMGADGDTITLANFGGTAWFEVARSANPI